ELSALAKAADEKFGDSAPSFSNAREAFSEMKALLDPILRKKQEEEPDQSPQQEAGNPEPAPKASERSPSWSEGLPGDQSQFWSEAETLIRSGRVDEGLARMAVLAANETSGRARFIRKLMLVDLSLGAGRQKLAKTVLKELNSQIANYKLDQWESSALVGA